MKRKYPAIIMMMLASSLTFAPSPARADATPAPPTAGGDALITLDAPLTFSEAKELAGRSDHRAPFEIQFHNGEWTGGFVIASKEGAAGLFDASRLDQAVQNARFDRVRASEEALDHGPLSKLKGKRTRLASHTSSIAEERATASPMSAPCEMCEVRLNTTSSAPTLPGTGTLEQFRMQGIIEATIHHLRGLDAEGYPVTAFFLDDRNVIMKPDYIYEHDYKIIDNGYTTTDPSYEWQTNLPGAYRDTRATGLDTGDGQWLDTIGSAFTWQFDKNTDYKITTRVQSGTTVTSTRGKLTASVIPNDGGLSMTQAALKRGCSFLADHSAALNPYTDFRSIKGEWGDEGDLAWCGGIGDYIHPSYVTNMSLIAIPDFEIKADRTCYQWTLVQGAVNC